MGTADEERFFIEAQAALPLVDNSTDIETVFEGVLHQRMRLRMNQQLAEWHGLNDHPTGSS